MWCFTGETAVLYNHPMTPEKIGRYQLLEELGRGGMATVYRAYDPHFKREVAVKILPREFNHDPMFRARFQREAETIAALEHPAIVPVYDFGEDDGLPFLVMRLMSGDSLADRIAQGPIPVDEVAKILARVGSALDLAHELGIVHRDLKPGNILFDQYGEAYLADFGIARLAESSATLTGSGIVGTPAYMSPEQIQGREVDGRSDIYALGIIIFEMLTGQRPYDADTPAMVLVKQMTEPTPRILDVKPDLPPTCEEVIARAMAKDAAERYEYAGEVSQTLTGIVQQTAAMSAQPPPQRTAVAAPQPTAEQSPAAQSPTSRFPTWGWGLAGLLLLLILAGGAWAIWGRGKTNEPGTAVTPIQTPDTLTPDTLTPETQTPGTALTPASVDQLVALQRLGRGTVNTIAASPDGQTLAVGGSLGVWLYDSTSLEPQGLLSGHTDVVWDVAWSPNGTQLASASWDQTIRVWDVAAGETLFTLRGDDQYVKVAWSPDGSMLAAMTWYPAVELWDVARRQRTAVIELPDETIRDLAWSPDSTRIAATGEPGVIHIFDAASHTEVMEMAGHTGNANCVSWSPDGRMLASCGEEDSTVRLWDTTSGDLIYALEGHEYGVYNVAWIPDSDFLVSVGGNGRAIMWNVAEGWVERLLTESQSTLFDVAWLAGPQRLILATDDGALVSIAQDGGDEMVWHDHTDSLWDVSWSPDGAFLAAAGADSTVRVWRAQTGEPVGIWVAHEYGVTAVSWSLDKGTIATAGEDSWVYLWDVQTKAIARQWRDENTSISSMGWHPTQPRLALGDYDGHVWVWDIDNNTILRDWAAQDGEVTAVAWSPDGNKLATSGDDHTIHIWGMTDGSLDELTLSGHEDSVRDIAWSPDGLFLASVSFDQTARVWDAQNGDQTANLNAHNELVTSVAWSPNGSLLATGGWDNVIRLWDTENWWEVGTLTGHQQAAVGLAWSPDGSQLASSSEDGTVIIWGIEQ